MPNKIKSIKDLRKAKEKKGDTKFPGWDALEEESRQDKPTILLVIKDANGKVINTVKGTNKKGFNRVNWNLSYPSKSGERLRAPRGRRGFRGPGIMVTPGSYTVTLVKQMNGTQTILQEPETFQVVPLMESTLPRKSYQEMDNFREATFAFQQDLTATNIALSKSQQTIDAMLRALNKATSPSNDLYTRLHDAKTALLDIDKELHGNPVKDEIGERSNPTASDGNSLGWRALGNTYGPTDEHKGLLNRVQSQLKKVKAKLTPIVNSTLPALERDLKNAGAPWIEGQGLINN